MIYDCAIVGGGPAGLNAALVLGRARRSVALFDDAKPRNRVTHASHGYLTRDGVTPAEFRRVAYEEVLRYPTVRHVPEAAVEAVRAEDGFELRTGTGETVRARKLILAAGMKEALPDIEGVRDFYGKSLFACPFCDGWEMRDRPLAVVSDQPGLFHKTTLLVHWTRDLVVCTHGNADAITEDQREQLAARGIPVVDTRVEAFEGREGRLERLRFADGTHIGRTGGFLAPELLPSLRFEEALGYQTTKFGGIATDAMGKTSAPGVFAAGDSAYVNPSQLIYAAASGSMAAVSVMAELTEENWHRM